MRVHGILVLVLLVPGCSRDWELPSFEVNPNCRQDSDCAIGVCTDGQCLHRCLEDDDCGPDLVCRQTGGADYALCMGMDGPAVVGDPQALSLLSNLRPAIDFALLEHDDVSLLQISCYGLKADGTIDITESGSQLMIQMQAGRETPVTMITITYSDHFDVGYGAASEVGGYPAMPIIEEQTWDRFQDSPELLAAFLAEPDCDAPQATQSDVMNYAVSDGEAYFGIVTLEGDSALGDPISGEFSLVGCSP